MGRKMVIAIIIIIVLLCLSLINCVTTSEYQTYRENISSNNKELGYISNYEKGNIRFQFHERGIVNNGKIFLKEKFILTKPYGLDIKFKVHAKKIIVNKLILQTENTLIDLFDKDYTLVLSGNVPAHKFYNAEELVFFKNTRIINIDNLNDGWKDFEWRKDQEWNEINSIEFWFYRNIDVNFEIDQYFIIEGEIVFENDTTDFETKIFNFVTKFDRTNIKVKESLLGILLEPVLRKLFPLRW
jgi:hypothetical protein